MITINKNGKDFNLKYIKHMLHYTNLENVLTHGLLSHNAAYDKKLITKDISMSEVQDRRKKKNININGKSINVHDFVSFYFQPRNPMLYRRKDIQSELIIVLVNADILKTNITESRYAIFTDGNAGSDSTKFYTGVDQMKNVDFELLISGSWNHDDEDIKRENKRKMCSEVLVYPSIIVSEIEKIICPNRKMYDYVLDTIKKHGGNVKHIEVEIDMKYYF